MIDLSGQGMLLSWHDFRSVTTLSINQLITPIRLLIGYSITFGFARLTGQHSVHRPKMMEMTVIMAAITQIYLSINMD